MASTRSAIHVNTDADNMMRLRSKQVSAYLKAHPIKNLLVVLTRNKNQNCVCYQAQLVGTQYFASTPMVAFWMDIDPQYQKANRAKGKMDDREELGAVEWRMAYGFKTVQRGNSKLPTEFAVTFQALKGRSALPLVLRIVDEKSVLIATSRDGERFYVQRIHVNEKEGLVMPTVVDVRVIGQHVGNGKRMVEVLRA